MATTVRNPRLLARAVIRRDEGFLVIFLLLLLMIFTILVPGLANPSTLADLVAEASLNLTAALGVTVLMLQKEFDVSIGSMLGLVGVVTVSVFNSTASIPLGMLAGLACGVVVGSIHGYLVVYQGLNSLMTTLASLFLIRGLIYVWTRQVTVTDKHNLVDFQNLYYGTAAGFPIPGVVALILFIVGGWLLSNTNMGRAVYAIGSNEGAARALGINVRLIKFFSFVICSTLAAVAGLLITAQTASGYFDAGQGFEFIVIAAVVLGGVALAGGRGTVYGAALGVLIIALTGKGLRLMGVYTTYQLVATGLFMMLAVFGYGIRERWARRRRQLARGTKMAAEAEASVG